MRIQAIVISMRIFLSFILFVLSAFVASLRLVHARLVALAPAALDLQTVLAFQNADEAPDGVGLPSGDLSDLVHRDAALAFEHRDHPGFGRSLAGDRLFACRRR